MSTDSGLQGSPILAVVDMGSNSFRLEVGRVEGGQIFRLDTWRETLHIGAGLDRRGQLTPEAQRLALACLARLSERLRGLHPSAVRVVATHTFRVATNASRFLARAERTIGFPIDVITGQEEARLIYVGVDHVLPASSERRLVIDIGGGSTEFIVGHAAKAEQVASLAIGCVNMTQRFFPEGKLGASMFVAAETAARAEVEAISGSFGREAWHSAYASSGTALALAEILEANGLSPAGITPVGLKRLRQRMIDAGDARRLRLAALKPERAEVLAGGLAIMTAAMTELGAQRVNPVGGALRLGVLYDLLGRAGHHDARTATIEQFLVRYQVDRAQASRVAAMALDLYRSAQPGADAVSMQRLEWAALLHEIGISVSHTGFHKHGAYILEHADMPGFSAGEQQALSRLVLGCRGGLAKLGSLPDDAGYRAMLVALRLAVLFHHARRPLVAPRIDLDARGSIRFDVAKRWLKSHPLSDLLLARERDEWAAAGWPWRPVLRRASPARRR